MINTIHDALQTSSLSSYGFKIAIELGCCIRCCYRFANIQITNFYTIDDEMLLNAMKKYCGDEIINSLQFHEVCNCCFEILNPVVYNQILQDITQIAKETKYETETCALNIKLPGTILLREYVFMHQLTQKVENYTLKAPYPIKEILKSILCKDIAQLFHCTDCISKSEFSIRLVYSHDESAEEVKQIPSVKRQLESTRKRKHGPQPVFDGYGVVHRGLQELHGEIPSTMKSPPLTINTKATCQILIERDPVYIQGSYLKYKRGLSQTPWTLDGVRIGESSVEEAIGELVLPYFHGNGYKFHSAGREDIDVRMLGNGRPFILEILDAKKIKFTPEEYAEIQNTVNKGNNGAVEIRHLKDSNKEYFSRLQNGADSKRKTYCCVVWSKNPLVPEALEKLNSIQDLVIQQQTPIRVLHRRTLLTRPKVIHNANCQVLNAHYMLLRVTTSAGTYVKEFVHGDRGRTNPNVASILGCEADILQLDVENLLDMTV